MSTTAIRNIHILYVVLNHIEQIHTSIRMDLGVVDLSAEDLEELACDQREITRILGEIRKLQDQMKQARTELEVQDVERASALLFVSTGDLLMKAETLSQL
jgi:hypothetical protein